MAIIKPKRLKSGDLIGLISPASSPHDLTRINKSVEYLEKIGYKVEVGKNVGLVNGYLAGSDKQRLEDLHDMFRNKNVKAVFTLRGGYGSARLLDKIDYTLIKNNPKIFVGYSDINALQMAFYTKCGLITFAGPMAAVDFYDEISPFTEELFWRIVSSDKKIGRIENPNKEKIFVLNKGRAEGRLLGGNLSILTSLMGTDYFPKLKDSILYFEEINEPPYRIDRMFNHLRLSKMLKGIRGIILGRFVDCYETDTEKATLTLNEVVLDYFNSVKMPVVYNFKHGHIKDNITLPYGIKCVLNASRDFFEIPESAVN